MFYSRSMAEVEFPSLQEVTDLISDMWGLLDEEEKEMFYGSLTLHRYRKNEMIYSEGESPNHLLCLLSGKVKIYRDGVGGRSQIVRLIRPVQYFGYRASLAGEPFVTAAAAFEPSVICAIPMMLVKRAMERNNALSMFFIKELAVDLGISDRRTVGLTQKHIRGRLAEAILFLQETYGTNEEDNSMNIKLSREDVANLSNMTTSNAIRTLSAFSSEGLLEINGRKIRILDEERLRRISNIG